MEIKINFEIGLRPEMEEFLRGLFGVGAAPRMESAGTAESDAENDSNDAERGLRSPLTPIPAEGGPAPRLESEGSEGVAVQGFEGSDKGEGTGGPAPRLESEGSEGVAVQGSEGVAEEAPREITDEALRGAMNAMFEKFLGEDWEDAKDRETVARRRSLTDCFKRIAQHLGAAKPTGLPQARRQDFLLYLDSIKLEGGSGLCVWDPF